MSGRKYIIRTSFWMNLKISGDHVQNFFVPHQLWVSLTQKLKFERRLYGARILDHIQGRKIEKGKAKQIRESNHIPCCIVKRGTFGFQAPHLKYLFHFKEKTRPQLCKVSPGREYFQNSFLDEFWNHWRSFHVENLFCTTSPLSEHDFYRKPNFEISLQPQSCKNS